MDQYLNFQDTKATFLDKTRQKDFSDTNKSWNSKTKFLQQTKKNRSNFMVNKIGFLEKKMEEQKIETNEKFQDLKDQISKTFKKFSEQQKIELENINSQTEEICFQIESNLVFVQQETKNRKNQELKTISQIDKKNEICKNHLQVEEKNRLDDLEKLKKQIQQEIPLIQEQCENSIEQQDFFVEEIKQKFVVELNTINENQQNILNSRLEQEEAINKMIQDIELRTNKELKDLKTQRIQSQNELEILLNNAQKKINQAINNQFQKFQIFIMQKRTQSKTSFVIEDQNTVNVMNSISKAKLEELKHDFMHYKENHNGSVYISQENCFLILQQNGFFIDDNRKLDLVNLIENSKKIDYNKFAKILVFILQQQNNKNDVQNNYEYIDAFVALGGQNDGSGYIQITYLQKVLEQFELNVDINNVLEQMGVEEQEIEYLIFCKLFDTPIFEDKQSMHSYFTQKSIYSSVSQFSNQFERNLNDFEKFMSQHPTFFDQQNC